MATVKRWLAGLLIATGTSLWFGGHSRLGLAA